jgi:hypothetical protein
VDGDHLGGMLTSLWIGMWSVVGLNCHDVRVI